MTHQEICACMSVLNPRSFEVGRCCFLPLPPRLSVHITGLPPDSLCPLASPVLSTQRCSTSLRMSTFSETVWLCLAVTVVLGGLALGNLRKIPGQMRRKVVCLAGLWGGAYLLFSLSLSWGLILFFLSCVLTYTYLSGQELLPVDQKAVLITGGDSGFGHALSKYLDELGFTVFVGVLDEKGSGAEELRRTCSKRLSVLQMDITDQQQIKDAHSKVVEKLQDRGLWAVVNNAGIICLPADGELIPMTDYKKCMAVNFFGAVEVTKAFLPLLRKSKGRLVNISSMADIAGTSEMWSKLEKNILDHLSSDVEEDYGKDYILQQRNYLKSINIKTNTDISPVLQDIRHAVSAKSPFAFYAPGALAYCLLFFVSFSPTGIFDYFSKKLCEVRGSMPRALIKQP
ncbi:17-beta-hydroxysteroid dehydrogenase type 2 isoform X3 [Canis lupus baileyi]|uniref:17-beta-hydroxysteroid dehydrogenase type 2 isoform X3 n=1 Tax=Canis lupus familiaris TaxID=9615 RepID=UPI000BAA23ED|nr:17-beta-hydroxysteroid dehydrogenase type 2 isoform X3 [Canis lupus familiaris]XP_025282760.1 17-beta-hydroxysteroid dehydrogenase type 2 isoform X3 [Canis lupus dingo]XP_038394114.1 17-beta-hydroxysteroid dehydrogenase type 2 isoform X3 [Canis lupus familiaris]XP_038522854.1 17-beta-hydroxysteroid dehydrogenase type 2 isoform X3 [Canis lupus familiaris]|eukprot:XP_022274833.1 estradiol 17-beta-dehydrogenase 2 isoform X3 [Canis lupus familiaris]